MLFAGIDVGSATSKCVLLWGGEIAGSALVDMGIGTAGPERAYSDALAAAGAAPEDIACCAATGYGRAAWKGADLTISELTAHGLGNHFLFPKVRTVIDIGGQDAKVIQLDADGLQWAATPYSETSCMSRVRICTSKGMPSVPMTVV